MKHRFVSLAAVLIGVTLLIIGCAQSTPAPSPTKASAPSTAAPAATVATAPTKASEPTKAEKVSPTSAPVKKTNFPEKGKTITVIVSFAAGGPVDTRARLVAPVLENGLGIPVQVLVKAGAGGQLGWTDLAQAKPDGYTLGMMAGPALEAVYLDPERKAAFGPQSFDWVAMLDADPTTVAVPSESSYSSLKDLLDAAKANPEKLNVATTGIGNTAHLAGVDLGRVSGAKFSYVHTDGSSAAMTALLGRHVDIGMTSVSMIPPQLQNKQLRALAVMDKVRSAFLPDVKTAEEQGYAAYMSSPQGIAMPAGTPKEIVDLVSGLIKDAVNSSAYRDKAKSMFVEPRYLNADQYKAWEVDYEARIKTLLPLALAR